MPVVVIKKVKPNGFGHRTLMIGTAFPTFWELFLLRWRTKTVTFIGKGTKWFEYPGTKAVSKSLAKQLENQEKQFLMYHH